MVYEDYNHHDFPGWDAGTVGYHVDDGKIFEGVARRGREVEGMGYLDNKCHLSTTVFTQVSSPYKFVPDHLREFSPEARRVRTHFYHFAPKSFHSFSDG